MPYVALLRGINVGGNNKVEMARLRTVLTGLGFSNVSTYINSGNAFFETREKDGRKLEAMIERALADEFGLTLSVVVRSRAEVRKIVKAIPADWHTRVDRRYYILFLRHTIDDRNILARIPFRKDVEDIAYCPGALLWSILLDKITRSEVGKLTQYDFYRDITIRNLNTTLKIAGIMEAMG